MSDHWDDPSGAYERAYPPTAPTDAYASQQPGAYPPPPPPPTGEPPSPEPPRQPYRLRTRDKVIAFSIGGLVLVGIIAAAVGGAGDDSETSATAEETATTAEPAEGTDQPATTEPPTTTTTEPPTTTIPVVESGVYPVPAEFAPGTYRVSGYWARLDANQEIIANGIADNGLMILDVAPTDAFVEINGEAIALAGRPKVDPIAEGFTDGTYLVGVDVAPGQYRVTPAGTDAYWARLDRAHEIIDNNISAGQLIVQVAPSDYLLEITGTLEAM
jgi:hypothetical protein